METLKKVLLSIWQESTKKRGISFYFAAASLAFVAAMLILYTQTGITAFTPVLSGKVIALLGVCIAVAALFSMFEIKIGKYVLYLFCLWMWLEYLISEAAYISNVFVAIDGNSFSTAFVLTALFGIFACTSALVSAILQKKEIGSSKKQGEPAAALGGGINK